MKAHVKRFLRDGKLKKEHKSVNIRINEGKIGLYGSRWSYIAEGVIETISVIHDTEKGLLILPTVILGHNDDRLCRERWEICNIERSK